MAIERLNIQPEKLRWAIQRAGVSEEKAIEAFPLLNDWLSQDKQPTLSQLKKFAARFYVPFGYLFLGNLPVENIPFPMFRGGAGQQSHFDLNVYDTVMGVQEELADGCLATRMAFLAEYL